MYSFLIALYYEVFVKNRCPPRNKNWHIQAPCYFKIYIWRSINRDCNDFVGPPYRQRYQAVIDSFLANSPPLIWRYFLGITTEPHFSDRSADYSSLWQLIWDRRGRRLSKSRSIAPKKKTNKISRLDFLRLDKKTAC